MSNPSDADWKRMAALVKQFHDRPDAEPFRAPVDYEALGLMDYPMIIKEPMDLGTVLKRIKGRQYYKSIYAAADDVRKVWRNCMTYNADGSDFYKLAESLQKRWDEKYAKFLQESSGGAPPGAAPDGSAASTASLQDRRNFAKSLYTISKEDLGRVLVELEAKCSFALKRNASEDEVEVNVDQIPYGVLQELTAWINGAASGMGGGATKKKKKAAGAASKKARTG